jgi:hypothetical protein
MNKYRSAALVLATCAAGLSVAACSAGSPAASSSSTSSASPDQSVSAAATGPAVAGRTISVKGPLGSFPVPAGAKIGENISGGQSVVIVFGSVTPSDVSSFYASALPKAGFDVTTNAMVTKAGDSGALIEFTGHGYKGNIDALKQFPGPSLAGIGDTNVTTIIFSPTK